jgi:hypothetical protein
MAFETDPGSKLIQNRIRRTRRATLWQRTEVGWQILFHQGTIVEAE